MLYIREKIAWKNCTSFREHTNVINFEKEKVLPLTKKKELKLHQDVVACYICRKRFSKKFTNYKNYQKVRDHYNLKCKYRSAAFSICNLRFDMPNKVPVNFQNGSNYDYHFVIKELVDKFEGQFQYLAENIKN